MRGNSNYLSKVREMQCSAQDEVPNSEKKKEIHAFGQLADAIARVV